MSRLSGQATVGGSPQANVPIAIIDTNGSSDPSQWSIVATTTTDANGDWEVTGLATNAVERYHAVAQYDDGAQLYNVESLPYLSTDAYLAAPTAEWSYQTPPATIANAIPDSVVNRWPVDEGSGSTVGDAEGSNDLSGSGGIAWETQSDAIGGYEIYLDGTDDELDGAIIPEIDVGVAFSFALTITPSTFSDRQAVVNQTNSSGNRFGIGIETDGQVSAALYDGSNFVGEASQSISTGNRYRVVYTYDGASTGTIYVNKNGVSGGDTPLNLDNQAFKIGARVDGSFNYEGRVDEPLVANDEWSQSAVDDDYNRQPWTA